MAEQGWSYKAIAAAVDLHRNSVARLLRREAEPVAEGSNGSTLNNPPGIQSKQPTAPIPTNGSTKPAAVHPPSATTLAKPTSPVPATPNQSERDRMSRAFISLDKEYNPKALVKEIGMTPAEAEKVVLDWCRMTGVSDALNALEILRQEGLAPSEVADLLLGAREVANALSESTANVLAFPFWYKEDRKKLQAQLAHLEIQKALRSGELDEMINAIVDFHAKIESIKQEIRILQNQRDVYRQMLADEKRKVDEVMELAKQIQDAAWLKESLEKEIEQLRREK